MANTHLVVEHEYPKARFQDRQRLKPILEGIEDWTEANIHDVVMAAIPGLGMKNGQMLWPMRIAISGQRPALDN